MMTTVAVMFMIAFGIKSAVFRRWGFSGCRRLIARSPWRCRRSSLGC